MAVTKRLGNSSSPLDRSDFIDVPEPTAQAINLIFADTGHGKTSYLLSHCPDPVAFCDINRRGYGAAKKAREEGRIIRYLPVDYPVNYTKSTVDEVMKAAQKSVDRMEKNWDLALEANLKGDVATIGVDTMTEYAEIVMMALVGRPERRDDDFGKSSAAQKAVITNMLKRARETNIHVVMLAQVKEIYEVPPGKTRKEASGKYTFRGPDVMNTDADWSGHLRFQKMISAKLRGSEKAKLHEIEFTKAGYYLPALGQVIKEEDWMEMGGPFVAGCMANFPDSEFSDWMNVGDGDGEDE